MDGWSEPAVPCRSDGFLPAGACLLATSLTNVVASERLVYSWHRGLAEAEAFFVMVVPKPVLESLNRLQLLAESLNPALALTVINWWVTVPGQARELLASCRCAFSAPHACAPAAAFASRRDGAHRLTPRHCLARAARHRLEVAASTDLCAGPLPAE